MLVLFETPAGYALFKLLDAKKLKECDNLYKSFETPEAANKILSLKHFTKFHDTAEALQAATAAVEGKMSKPLKKLLKKLVVEAHDELAVADAKLGNCIKDKLDIQCVSNSAIHELMRCIRSQRESLIKGLPQKELSAMALGLAHSLSRYKLKFSPDKVDTMIVQAISLLDDLDKELNNYVMRAREWFGWHFPEMGKIVTDNLAFAKVVHKIGDRTNTSTTDLSDILPEEVEQEVKEAAEISMGTEVSEDDILNIRYLCEEVIEITEYRAQLYDYLKNRMIAIAPNLTVLVGELVGARLIAHAGSLINLAKHPSSTVQILGAEKALFRALKTKHDTPKYGLIYHASLVGQSNPKMKGKVSRMLAAKASLAVRVDALGEDDNHELGLEHQAKLQNRLRHLEAGHTGRLSGTGKNRTAFDKYENKSQVFEYNTAADSTLPSVSKKRKHEVDEEKQSKKIKTVEEVVSPKKKKKKHSVEEDENEETEPKPKKKKKSSAGDLDMDTSALDSSIKEEQSSSKKKKKKKKHSESADSTFDASALEESVIEDDQGSIKKKKKKKKHSEDGDDSTLNSTADTSTLDVSNSLKKKKKKKHVEENGDSSMDTSAFDALLDTSTGEKKKKKKKKKQQDDD